MIHIDKICFELVSGEHLHFLVYGRVHYTTDITTGLYSRYYTHEISYSVDRPLGDVSKQPLTEVMLFHRALELREEEEREEYATH